MTSDGNRIEPSSSGNKAQEKNRWYRAKVIAEYLESSFSVKIAVRLGQMFGWLGIFIAAGTFLYNYSKDQKGRVEQSHFQAWTLINMQSGKPGNGGQIKALESLNRDRVSLEGVSLKGAFLEGLNLREARADSADFRGAQMSHANLSFGHFRKILAPAEVPR